MHASTARRAGVLCTRGIPGLSAVPSSSAAKIQNSTEPKKIHNQVFSVTEKQSLRWDANESGFRNKFKRSCKVFSGELASDVEIPSNLLDYRRQGYESYMEFGLLSEAEMLELNELQKGTPLPQSMKGKAVLLENYLGKKVLQFLISLRGLDCSTIHSIRRVKFHCSVGLSQEDMLLQAAKQLHRDQAHNNWTHNLKKQIECGPACMQEHNSYNSIQDLAGFKADIAKEAARRGEDINKGKGSGKGKGSDSEDDANSSGPRSKKVTGASARRFSEPAQPAKKPKSRVSKKGKQAGFEDDLNEVANVEVSSADIEKSLQPVVDELKSTPKCFLNLSISRIFAGEKLMRSVDAVQPSNVLVQMPCPDQTVAARVARELFMHVRGSLSVRVAEKQQQVATQVVGPHD